MERKYKKKSNLVNRTGYTPGYNTEKNPVNFIPSENITMANTPYPLHATPLDQNGNPIGSSVVMQPGEEYRFGGASYVAETPMFGHGGEKNDWISAKISKLVHEGYPQQQAVAIAYEMYDNVHGDGGYQIPKYQDGKKDYNFGNTFAGSNFAKPKFGADPNIQSPEQFSASLNKITAINPNENGLGVDPNKPSPLSEDSLTAGKDWAAKNPLPQGIEKPMSSNVFGAEVEDTKTKTATTGLEKPDIKGDQPFQFFNPYSGVDIPSASVMFGQSLENKDTLGAVASGAKVALGTARNILGGMGQARRENYVKNQYAEKQREGMTAQGRETMLSFGGYYQEGGAQPGMEEGLEGQTSNPQEESMEQQGGSQEQQIMQEVAQALQQGADPQQVIQQLVQMGMSQEQAVQIVQQVTQQVQGATPQMKRGGAMCYQEGGKAPGMTQGEVNNLAKKYNVSPSEFLKIVTEGDSSGKNFFRYEGGNTGIPTNYLETYREEQSSFPNTMKRGINKGLDYIGMKPVFNNGGYYQDGGEQQMAEQVSQALQQGAQPQQVMQMLLKSGMSQDQAVQLVQAVMQQIQQQGHNAQEEGAEGGQPNPQEEAMEQGTPQMKRGGYHQQGGIQSQGEEQAEGAASNPQEEQGEQGGQMQAIMQQVSQMLQQGADPQQILQQLVEAGIPQQQAQQIVQAAMQQMQAQGHNPQEEGAEGGQPNPQEEQMEQGTPQMRKGGEYLNALKGKTIKDYTFNSATGKYEVSYE